MAIATECQTPDCIYVTNIDCYMDVVTVKIRLPHTFRLDEKEAMILEANLHNAIELVLRPYLLTKPLTTPAFDPARHFVRDNIVRDKDSSYRPSDLEKKLGE